MTTLASCGPMIPDVYELPDGYGCLMEQMSYKEDKIAKSVSMWLNHKDRKITEAKEIGIYEALDQFRDLGEYLRGTVHVHEEGESEDGNSD